MPLPQDFEKRKYMFTDDIKFLQKAVVFHPVDKNKFLTLRLSMEHHWHPGKWDLPGGNVLFGENAEESLRSEIKQESGLEVTGLKPRYIITKMKEEFYYLFIGYVCECMSTDIILGDEHIEYRWVTKDEFKQLNPPASLLDVINSID